MNRSTHPVEPEEVMAYLDGELLPARAAAVAAHMAECEDCQIISNDLRSVSQQLLTLEAEPMPQRVNDSVLAAAKESASEKKSPLAQVIELQKPTWRRLITSPYVWSAAFLLLVAFVGMFFSSASYRKTIPEARRIAAVSTNISPIYPGAIPSSRRAGGGGGSGRTEEETQRTVADLRGSRNDLLEKESKAPTISGAMIAYTASLSLQASNFDSVRPSVERIVAQHQGYIFELTANSPSGSSKELTAKLRVLADQLDSTLNELRALGHVEQESRASEDVSSQYVDLVARLKSARATEQRIIALIAERTGKLSDVLEAEQELERVRGEIESMESQRANFEHRVRYSSIELNVAEQYREQLNGGAISAGMRIRNAMVEGFRNLRDGALELLLFLLSYGPALLFWLGLLGVPAWFVWRLMKATAAAAKPASIKP